MTRFDEVLAKDEPFVCPSCGSIGPIDHSYDPTQLSEATITCENCGGSISSWDMSREVPSYFVEVRGHEVVFMDGRAQCTECGVSSRNELDDFPRANDDIVRMFLIGQLFDNDTTLQSFDEWVDDII